MEFIGVAFAGAGLSRWGLSALRLPGRVCRGRVYRRCVCRGGFVAGGFIGVAFAGAGLSGWGLSALRLPGRVWLEGVVIGGGGCETRPYGRLFALCPPTHRPIYPSTQLDEDRSTPLPLQSVKLLLGGNGVNQAKKNVALLVLCQALAMTTMTVLITVSALAGSNLTENSALATLPLAVMQIAVMVATIPASMLMRRFGRRLGFLVGTSIAMVGGGLGAIAILSNSFLLFCVSLGCVGIFNGFSGFYRFAAADAAEEAFRPQAISLVIAGGVLAALIGPTLAIQSKEWLSTVYAGTFLVVVALQIPTIFLLLGVHIPPMPIADRQFSGRPLAEIMQQPVFGVAVAGSMVGYGIMAFLMTATPLAMMAIAHPFESAASVIQWHVLGMFAPSFFTGFLIARFGVLTILLMGTVLNLCCIGTTLLGDSLIHFHIALTLLGVGWNFMFVSATALLTEAYTSAEKAKTQAAHDFLMFAFVALCTYLSGELLNRIGWMGMNLVAIAPLVMVLGATLWLMRWRQRAIA